MKKGMGEAEGKEGGGEVGDRRRGNGKDGERGTRKKEEKRKEKNI